MPIGLRGFLQRNWFFIAIPTTIGASYAAPQYCRSHGTFRVDAWKDYATMMMFVCSGVAIPGVSSFKATMMSLGPLRHALIQGVSLLGMPLGVYLTAPWLCDRLHLPDVCATGATFVACLPTTIGLCIALTRAVGGDVLLATFHSALGNTVGPFITPITATLFAGVSPDVNVGDVLRRLGSLIILPMAVGMCLRSAFPLRFATATASRRAGALQQLCLLVILSNVFSNSFASANNRGGRDGSTNTATSSHKSSSITRDMLLGMGILMAGYYAVFFIGMTAAMASVMPRVFGEAPSCIAAVYCSTQKTAAMGLPMLELLFQGSPDLDILVTQLMLFHMFQIVFGGLVGPVILKRALLRRRSL